jgi:hypothetical protein
VSDTLGIITETKVTRRLDLGDCEPSWVGAVFDVWVAPPREHLEAFGEYNDWLGEHADEEGVIEPDAVPEMYELLDPWLAETWTNIPPEEVTPLRKHIQSVSWDIWEWLYTETLNAILDYRQAKVKN